MLARVAGARKRAKVRKDATMEAWQRARRRQRKAHREEILKRKGATRKQEPAAKIHLRAKPTKAEAERAAKILMAQTALGIRMALRATTQLETIAALLESLLVDFRKIRVDVATEMLAMGMEVPKLVETR